MWSEIEAYKESLTLRTSKLWPQFRDQVLVILDFLIAEWLGNFKLHLTSLHRLLPYLGAAGHNQYLMGASLYLEKMGN